MPTLQPASLLPPNSYLSQTPLPSPLQHANAMLRELCNFASESVSQ